MLGILPGTMLGVLPGTMLGVLPGTMLGIHPWVYIPGTPSWVHLSPGCTCRTAARWVGDGLTALEGGVTELFVSDGRVTVLRTVLPPLLSKTRFTVGRCCSCP